MLLIRPARSSDSEVLAHLFLQARRAAFTWLDPACCQLADFAAQTSGETIWVATLPEETVVGFISVWVPTCFVHHLFVTPAYQSRGVGAHLLASLSSWLPFPHTLKCLTRNTRALTFYQKQGWSIIGSDGQGDDAYYLLQCKSPPLAPSTAVSPLPTTKL